MQSRRRMRGGAGRARSYEQLLPSLDALSDRAEGHGSTLRERLAKGTWNLGKSLWNNRDGSGVHSARGKKVKDFARYAYSELKPKLHRLGSAAWKAVTGGKRKRRGIGGRGRFGLDGNVGINVPFWGGKKGAKGKGKKRRC